MKAMKIHTKDFRVIEGDKVDLDKWPTKVDPVYKSKKQNNMRSFWRIMLRSSARNNSFITRQIAMRSC